MPVRLYPNWNTAQAVITPGRRLWHFESERSCFENTAQFLWPVQAYKLQLNCLVQDGRK